jgi:hypothetical protein
LIPKNLKKGEISKYLLAAIYFLLFPFEDIDGIISACYYFLFAFNGINSIISLFSEQKMASARGNEVEEPIANVYDQQRRERIANNKRMLDSLIPSTSNGAQHRQTKKRTKVFSKHFL